MSDNELSDEDADFLNAETFDSAEIGDWEFEHEQFVSLRQKSSDKSPAADQLPKFWESPGDLSFLWHGSTPDANRNITDDERPGRGVDVEQVLQKLVTDDEVYEDPAILDLSRKISKQKLDDAMFRKISNAPAYPNVSATPFDALKDIWKSEDVETLNSNADSAALRELVKRLGIRVSNIESPEESVVSNIGSANDSFYDHISSKDSHSEAALQLSTPFVAMPPFVHTDSRINPRVPPHEREYDTLLPRVSDASNVPAASIYSSNFIKHATAPYPPFYVPSETGSTEKPITTTIPPLMNAHQPFLPNSTRFGLCNPHLFNCPPPPLMGVRSARRMPLLPSNAPAMDRFQVPFRFSATLHRTVLPLFAIRVPPPPSPFVSSAPLVTASGVTNTIQSPVNSVFPNRPSFPYSFQQQPFNTYCEEPFNPDHGSWMSEFDCYRVRSVLTRTLIVSNPYVQDYYYAVRWLRQRRSSTPDRHVVPSNRFDPVMLMPSPIAVEDLLDTNHSPHYTSLRHRLAVPLAILPSFHSSSGIGELPRHDDNSKESLDETVEENSNNNNNINNNDGNTSPVTGTPEPSVLSQKISSNPNGMRIILESSLYSILVDELARNKSSYPLELNKTHTKAHDGIDRPPPSLRSIRYRRLLLARIERMYTLLLSLDEVQISLVRIVVQNDARSYLSNHRQHLIDRLCQELLLSTTESSSRLTDADGFKLVPSLSIDGDHQLHATIMDLFTVRKGIRLFANMLHHLPQVYVLACLREFIVHYQTVQSRSSAFIEECTDVLYSNLRQVIYSLSAVTPLLDTCFPDIGTVLETDSTSKPLVQALLNSNLGLSLVFSLLDMCARLSKPHNPTDFIRFGAFFIYLAASLPDTEEPRQPLESFPHLASILPLYINPDQHPPLTLLQVHNFCRTMHPNHGEESCRNNSNHDHNKHTDPTGLSSVCNSSNKMTSPPVALEDEVAVDRSVLLDTSAEAERTQVSSLLSAIEAT